ncbi:MAG: DUF6206 family protein [Acidimicrobiia bacterium]|nr:DUF6206 family protein [Acidimicrobiia bacterium]
MQAPPRFADRAAFDRYAELLDDYLDALRSVGVEPVSSELVPVPVPVPVDVGGGVGGGLDGLIAYCVQPAFDPSWLATNVLCEPGSDVFLAEIVDTTVRTIGPRLGLDAQVSNWARVDDRLVYLDVTTPLMRSDDGSERLDTGIFLASLPWAMRGVVRRFLLSEILSHYYDARAALLDLAGNLVKERLDTHIPSAVALANAYVEPTITEHEARAYYRSDARTWGLLQRIRRVDRGWQKNVRRRVYPFLLPGRIER